MIIMIKNKIMEIIIIIRKSQFRKKEYEKKNSQILIYL